jgi:hypothetical protein
MRIGFCINPFRWAYEREVFKFEIARRTMALHKLCGSDPLLEFIRETYDAIPLRVPDQRVIPLALFTRTEKRMRYVGHVSQLRAKGWAPPPEQSADLAKMSYQSTNSLAWTAVTNLIGPLLSQMLSAAQVDVEASLCASRARKDGIRLVLGGAKRLYVDPISCALEFEQNPLVLPRSLDESRDSNVPPFLYVVDSILTAKQISINSDDDSRGEFSEKLEADLVGKLSSSSIMRRKSGLTITASERFPFAFTCLQLSLNQAREVTGLATAGSIKYLGATAAGAMILPSHSSFGESNQLVSFDD